MTERVKKRKGLKIFLIVLLTLVLIGALMLVLYYELPYRPVGNDRDKLTAIPFSSAEDVDRVYSDFASFGYYRTIDPHEIFYLFQGATKEDASISSDEAPSDGAAPDYSGTNTQVEGIDEADIVKTDGKYIYAVNSYKLNILSASNGVTEKLSSISLEGSSNEFYIYGDTLAIVYYSNDIGTSNATGYGIKVYSIADRSAPRLIRTVEHGGEYAESRLKDGVIYYTVRSRFYGELPYLYDGAAGYDGAFPYDKAFYFDGLPSYEICVIGKIDLLDAARDGYRCYVGVGENMYMSENYIYLTSTDASNMYRTNGLRTYIDNNAAAMTRVARFGLDDLAFAGATEVNGTLKDRYCMDEYEGNFRIATTAGAEGSAVYVLNAELKVMGKAENIAPGESIYSVRFNGDTATIVTFLQIDPVFKVDLSDPASPKVSEGLKKDGVSYYLHYIEGTDYVIGLGRDTSGGMTTGLEVVLFDMSGAEAKVINTVIIGSSYGYSETLYDPRGILYDKERDLFGFAAEVYSSSGEYKQSYYMFGFKDGVLRLRATVGHDASMDSRYEIIDGDGYYTDNYAVKRAVQIGDYVYAVSNRLVTAHSIADNFALVGVTEL